MYCSDGYDAQPCSECLSYGFHKPNCSQNPRYQIREELKRQIREDIDADFEPFFESFDEN